MNDMCDLLVVRDDFRKIKNTPGVYILLSDEKVPLYVGRSKKLRDRVKSHLSASGNFFISAHTRKFYLIGVIYHDDISTLDEKETEIIRLIKPKLNTSKVDYPKDFDLSSINEYEQFEFETCKQEISPDVTCILHANESGYCYLHNPKKIIKPIVPSWILRGKLITSEMQRLLSGANIRHPLTFYMSKLTFGKLLQEKTFAEIDYINEEVVLKFKKHYIVIDEDETVRLETRQPYNI